MWSSVIGENELLRPGTSKPWPRASQVTLAKPCTWARRVLRPSMEPSVHFDESACLPGNYASIRAKLR